jgi:hypothetical protein
MPSIRPLVEDVSKKARATFAQELRFMGCYPRSFFPSAGPLLLCAESHPGRTVVLLQPDRPLNPSLGVPEM